MMCPRSLAHRSTSSAVPNMSKCLRRVVSRNSSPGLENTRSRSSDELLLLSPVPWPCTRAKAAACSRCTRPCSSASVSRGESSAPVWSFTSKWQYASTSSTSCRSRANGSSPLVPLVVVALARARLQRTGRCMSSSSVLRNRRVLSCDKRSTSSSANRSKQRSADDEEEEAVWVGNVTMSSRVRRKVCTSPAIHEASGRDNAAEEDDDVADADAALSPLEDDDDDVLRFLPLAAPPSALDDGGGC